MKKYYFFNGEKRFFLGTVDLESAEKEIGLNCIYERYNQIPSGLRMLNRIHTSIKINEKINLPFKRIWHRFDALERLEQKDVLIVTDASIRKMQLKDLKRLKNKGVHIYLVFLNTAKTEGGKYALSLVNKFQFSHIFTIDSKDAEKYGFEYTNQVYFKNDIKKIYYPLKQVGVLFVGFSKNRLDLLYKINELIKQTTLFVSGVSEEEKKDVDGIIFNKYIQYDQVINYVLNCDCILEVVQDGQNGLTYRDYEAICYNKKLLTNNKAVFSMSEYNPQYIQYFERPEDINVEFVFSDIKIDYKYDGKYSPRRLVERIRDIENEII